MLGKHQSRMRPSSIRLGADKFEHLCLADTDESGGLRGALPFEAMVEAFVGESGRAGIRWVRGT
jgi:hypothetical protein